MKSLLKLHVEFDCELPELATHQEVQEWLQFRLGVGARSWIATSNPLEDSELKAILGTVQWKAF